MFKCHSEIAEEKRRVKTTAACGKEAVSPLFHHGQREVTDDQGQRANSSHQESEGATGEKSDVFTETWLHQDIPGHFISISGLQTVRL